MQGKIKRYNEKSDCIKESVYIDDGNSGTRFDRPGFTAMMEEVEAGRVEAIITKDMSRLGRDYLKAGLQVKGVRLIAINDGVWTVSTGAGDWTGSVFFKSDY